MANDRQLTLPLASPPTAVEGQARAPIAQKTIIATTSSEPTVDFTTLVEVDAAKPSTPATPKSRLLENALRLRLGEIRLKITDNRSTLLSTSTRQGVKTVRVHQLFLDADPSLFHDVAAYLASGDAAAGHRLDAFIEAHDHLLDHHVKELPAGSHLGIHHDLLEIFMAINGAYFQPAIRADITWAMSARGGSKRRRSSMTLGTYDDRSARIHIHPSLDQAWVPRLCVARIVHHEMLHAKHPPKVGNDGRRSVHGPVFRREEATFRGAKDADIWFELNLDRLLRHRAKRGRKNAQSELQPREAIPESSPKNGRSS